MSFPLTPNAKPVSATLEPNDGSNRQKVLLELMSSFAEIRTYNYCCCYYSITLHFQILPIPQRVYIEKL
jgi:hypothetical protein